MGCLACKLACTRPPAAPGGVCLGGPAAPAPTTPYQWHWQTREDSVHPPTGHGAIERVQFTTPESTKLPAPSGSGVIMITSPPRDSDQCVRSSSGVSASCTGAARDSESGSERAAARAALPVSEVTAR